MTEKIASLKQDIDKQAHIIIKLVDEFAKQHNDAITKTRDGKKQFVDLVEASAQACCIDEFKLYIKYKGAKEGTRSLWGGLANPFNAKIEKLIEDVANKIDKDSEIVKLEVLKRFCGYLMWRTHADISERGGW
jgi:hypothetical protein